MLDDGGRYPCIVDGKRAVAIGLDADLGKALRPVACKQRLAGEPAQHALQVAHGGIARKRPRHRSIDARRSEEHTSELQSLMRISYAVFCLKKKNHQYNTKIDIYPYNTII